MVTITATATVTGIIMVTVAETVTELIVMMTLITVS